MLKFDCSWQLQHFLKQIVVHYSMGNTFQNGDAYSVRNFDRDNQSIHQPTKVFFENWVVDRDSIHPGNFRQGTWKP